MRFRVSHSCVYEYSQPVYLEHHVIRLRPRSDPAQELLHFRLEIDPQPSLLTKALDPEGDSIYVAWFTDVTARLTVRAACEVETLRKDPFDYLLTRAEYAALPFRYEPALEGRVSFSTRPTGAGQDRVAEFLRPVADEAGWQTVAFLSLLNQRIFETFEVMRRHEGAPWTAAETLERRAGAGGDLAVLFIECCRRVGLAARFVSGYHQGDPDEREKDLHAWAEVYLPGGGWRGFDPAHGLAVADRHVAIASGASPDAAAPLAGTFLGIGATGTLTCKVELRTH